MRRSRPCSGPAVPDRQLLFGLVGLVVAVAAVAGCTSSQAGQATPGTKSSSPSRPASGSPSVRVSIPPRPAELKLDGVDPCTLFTDATLNQLQVDRKRPRTNGSQHYNGMAECVVDSIHAPYDTYDVTAATNEDVGEWFTGERNVQSTLGSVAGFPAATFWVAGANGRQAEACSVGVGVAAGQQLIVDFNNDSKRTYDLTQLCQRAERAAGMAVETLKALK